MENPRMKKGLGVIILLLFLATTCIPIVNASEEKPDLIIEDIFLWPSAYPYEYHFECSIKNIGDSPIWKDEFEIHVKIYWMLFGRIPLLPIFSHTTSVIVDGFLFGELKYNITFASCDSLPKFGSYRFYLTVNPNNTIDESDYDNNKYSEDWKVFFGQWKEIV